MFRHFGLSCTFPLTKRLSVRNEGHRPSQLNGNTCRARSLLPVIKSAFHIGFSRRVGRSGVSLVFRISDFSSRDHNTHHCYAILITMSKRARDQFWLVKTCKMQCYRDKRHGHTFRRDTYNGVVSFFIRFRE